MLDGLIIKDKEGKEYLISLISGMKTAPKSTQARGEWIKENRIRLGLNQNQLAEKLGTKQPNISSYESNRRGLRPEMINKMKKLFEVS